MIEPNENHQVKRNMKEETASTESTAQTRENETRYEKKKDEY